MDTETNSLVERLQNRLGVVAEEILQAGLRAEATGDRTLAETNLHKLVHVQTLFQALTVYTSNTKSGGTG